MLPELFLQRMQDQLGEEYGDFLESYDQEKHQAFRLNRLKRTEGGEDAVQKLTGLFRTEPVAWAKDGYYFDPSTRPGKHVYHETGLYYIQEPSAMAPVAFLDVRPGDRVLDLCAAPGGKSTQIGALLQGEGLLISNEINPSRAKILSENVERMGLINACVTNESPEKLAEIFPEYFDRILVDAPCSGEGMFRKNEIALTEWSPENVQMCGERQDGILDCAARMLRPGGRMVYSTCTFAEWENEGSVQRFLSRLPEFELVKNLEFPEKSGAKSRKFDGMLRLYPHRVRGEGHFLAVLQKQGEVPEGDRRPALSGTVKAASKQDLREWLEFSEENLENRLEHIFYSGGQRAQYLKFGEHLYMIPEDFPGLKGLKILRPGLHLGQIKKNRFEPSHALALALGPQDVCRVMKLHSEDQAARAYLNGLTFSADGQKGWCVICVDGLSLGWGKIAGGVMKNHYPKGLRKNDGEK